jgi:hypothetical protein
MVKKKEKNRPLTILKKINHSCAERCMEFYLRGEGKINEFEKK